MVTIDIYEDITPGLETRIRNQLPDSGPVIVRINSYGGAVDVGYTVRNILSEYSGHVTCIVDGVAASAASVIAVGGGDELVMRQGSELMIHQASLGFGGNAAAFKSMAERLEKMDSEIAQVYANKAGGSADEWLRRMEVETWFSATEAVAAGLADRVEGRTAMNVSVERIAAEYKYRGRRASPSSSKTIERSGMSFKDLAAELGWDEDGLKSALTRLKNETVETTVKVDVSYPQDTRIVPTETVTIAPVIGQPTESSSETGTDEGTNGVQNAVEVDTGSEPAPVAAEVIDGITFALNGEAEGFTATVDEKTGVLKVTASSGVEVGAEAQLTVNVSGTDVPVNVTVRSLSEEQDGSASEGDAVEPAVIENAVTVDMHTYNELVGNSRAYAKIKAEQDQAERHARVDKWISEGRISASARDEAIKVIDANEKLAVDIYGSRAVNTVPRYELGNVGSGESMSKIESLIAKGKHNLKNRK